MTKRYFVLGFLVCFAAAMILTLASCGSETPDQTVVGEDVEDLIASYNTMRQLGLAGKVDQFMAMRDSVTKAEVAAYFERREWVVDSARVSSWAFNWPELHEFELMQDSTVGPWRRLVFGKCGIFDKAGKEKCLYPMIMFRKNGNVWKVSNATRMSGPRHNADGSLHTLAQASYHNMFKLPPSFIDLQPSKPSEAGTGERGLPYDSIPVGTKIPKPGQKKDSGN